MLVLLQILSGALSASQLHSTSRISLHVTVQQGHRDLDANNVPGSLSHPCQLQYISYLLRRISY